MHKAYQCSNEALCLAVAAASDVDVLAAVLEELSRRADPFYGVDDRMNMFVAALTRHASARVREAALEVIGKRQLHGCIEAAYEALLRPESPEIWSTAAFAITQCPDVLEHAGANTLLRHTDTVAFRLRHCFGDASARHHLRDRLQEAHAALLRAGTT